MATPESLYKYVTAESAVTILNTGTLRWSSPELFDEPWSIPHEPNLGFDHFTINKVMLKTAVSMIFTRDMPPGNENHPLYKAIKRWRVEDRFKDEVEAFDALSELLAPTPETLEAKLKKITSAWRDLVSNSRMVSLSESAKEPMSWRLYADNYRGAVFKFSTEDTLANPQKVEYVSQRCRLTTIREQVDDLIGIQRAAGIETFQLKLLTKSLDEAMEKEWRCIQIMNEEELDCGEDVEDWYLDQPFHKSELLSVYFGFQMTDRHRNELVGLLKSNYPSAALFCAKQNEEQYEVDFEKLGK